MFLAHKSIKYKFGFMNGDRLLFRYLLNIISACPPVCCLSLMNMSDMSVTWYLRKHHKQLLLWVFKSTAQKATSASYYSLSVLVTKRDAKQLEVMAVMGLPSCCTLTHSLLPFKLHVSLYHSFPRWDWMAISSGNLCCICTLTCDDLQLLYFGHRWY